MRSPALFVSAAFMAAGIAAPHTAIAAPHTTPPASIDRSKIPLPAPPPKVQLPAPRRFQFASGAQLLVVERHTLPMVGIAVVWAAGAGTDPARKEGLASLTANLLDEGTDKHGPLELAAALQGLGSSIEAGSGWDSTVVSMVTLAKNLGASLDLLAEVTLHPAFAPREFERIKAEQIAATQQRKDAAQTVANDLFAEVVYGATGRYGLPAGGTEESLARLTRDDVIGFYNDQLPIGRAIVIVAGDVSADAVRGEIERRFGAAELAAKSPAPAFAAEAVPPPPRRVVSDRPGAPQSEVRLGLPGPPRSTPDYFPLLVMNEILGGGDFSNRLNLNLREAHAYTYGAHSAFGFRRNGGPFLIATAAKTAVTGPTINESFGELTRIRAGAVKPEELRFAKDGLERALARRFETLSDLVFELAAKEVYRLPDDFFSTFADKVEAVTGDDVLRVARAWLDLTRLSIVVVGDRAVIAPQLTGLPVGAFEGLAAPAGKKPAAAPAPPRPAR